MNIATTGWKMVIVPVQNIKLTWKETAESLVNCAQMVSEGDHDFQVELV